MSADDRQRMSIEERAAKRERLVAGRDRFGALLRTLQAGQELQLRPRGQRWLDRLGDWNWHPVGWTLVRAILVIAVALVAIKIGGDYLRQTSVDTWAGPDRTVTSGQQLSGCAAITGITTVEEYPNWLRLGGAVYVRTDAIRPGVIDGPDGGYRSTGYTLGNLILATIENTPEGKARDQVLVYSNGAMAGYVYQRAPGC